MSDEEKTSTSVYLRNDHLDWIERHNYNRSELFNHLMDEFRSGGHSVDSAINKYRMQEVEAEMRELEKRLEIKQSEYKELEDSVITPEQEKEAIWREAVTSLEPPAEHEMFKSRTPEWPTPDINGVQFYAEKLGITPEEFCEQWDEKEDEYGGDERGDDAS